MYEHGAESMESGFETAGFMPEAGWAEQTDPEAEWEQAGYEAAAGDAAGEWEWEHEAAAGEWEWEQSDETDPFAAAPEAGLLAPLAGLARKAIPVIAKAARPVIRRLIPVARQAAADVVTNVMRQTGMLPAARRGPRYGGLGPRRAAAARRLVQQLGMVLREGEREAAQLEAHYFGPDERESELASHDQAREAALTEVLAAEASHTPSESEAQALLGAALPITIRLLGADSALAPVLPALIVANRRLIRALHQRDRQLLRLHGPITRRTVSSLAAAERRGVPATPALARGLLASQAARVLRSPRLAQQGLVRNTTIRRATVAPAGQPVRARRDYR